MRKGETVVTSFPSFCCSIAILKYLGQKHSVAGHWYPADLQLQARVNEYLSWQHMNLRSHGSKVFLLKVRPLHFRLSGTNLLSQALQGSVNFC